MVTLDMTLTGGLVIVGVLTLTTGLEFTLGDVFFEVDCSFFSTVFLFCTTGLSDFTDNFWLVGRWLGGLDRRFFHVCWFFDVRWGRVTAEAWHCGEQ